MKRPREQPCPEPRPPRAHEVVDDDPPGGEAPTSGRVAHASRVTPREALAMQAFRLLEGCSTSEIARRFHPRRDTVRKALKVPYCVT
jgi:hypothetical protein